MTSGRSYLALVLVFVLTWSSAFPAAKIAIATAPPELFLGLRFLLAALVLLSWAALRGELRGVPWGRLALLGLLNQAGYQGLAWIGMTTVSAGLATIVTSLNPILVALLAAPLLGERLTRPKIAGVVLGFAGAAFIVRDHLAWGADPVGVLALFGGLASVVAGTLAFKRFAPPGLSLPVAVGAQQLASGAALLAVGLATEDPRAIQFSALFALTMAWFVAVVSVGAFLLWFLLLRRGSASSASALHFLMPPTGLVMSWAVLGEPLHALDLLGVVPIGLGIWLATQGASAPMARGESAPTPAPAAPPPAALGLPPARPARAGPPPAPSCGD
jgi:drug/metabolite transporter (DMT)-like permease